MELKEYLDRNKTYPFDDLEVGEYFKFNIEKMNSVRVQATAKKRRTGKVFSVSKKNLLVVRVK